MRICRYGNNQQAKVPVQLRKYNELHFRAKWSHPNSLGQILIGELRRPKMNNLWIWHLKVNKPWPTCWCREEVTTLLPPTSRIPMNVCKESERARSRRTFQQLTHQAERSCLGETETFRRLSRTIQKICWKWKRKATMEYYRGSLWLRFPNQKWDAIKQPHIILNSIRAWVRRAANWMTKTTMNL